MLSTFTQMVHDSTGLAIQSRNLGLSDSPSSCSHRVSLGQNVYCRILVSVMVGLALWTIPFTNGQRQQFHNVTASRAALATWEPAVDSNKFLSIPIAFVFQKSPKQSERGIRKATSKGVVFYHSPQIQVLDTDHIKSANDISSNFLHVVHASIGNMGMDLSYAQPSTSSPIATLLTACERPLSSSEFTLSISQISRVGDSLSVRKRSQPTDAEVNTNRLVGFGQLGAILVDHEGHKVATSSVFFDRYGSGIAFERARPTDIKSTEFGDSEITISGIPLKGALSVLGSLGSIFFLERWIFSTLLEKVVKSCLEMTKGLLNGYTRDFIKPSMIRHLLELCQLSRAGSIIHSLACVVGIGPESQSPVIDVPASTKCPRQNFLLFQSWVKPISVSHPHIPTIVHVRAVVKSPKRP